MTEEYPFGDPDDFKFPGMYFRKLREWDGEHEGYKSIIQGGLYRAMADPQEAEFSEQDAMDIIRTLENDGIREAEEQVYQQLRESDHYDGF